MLNMQWIVIGLVVLAICEPLLLDAKKVVLVMPRKIRRSHASPWHQLMMYAKKNGNHGQNYPGQRHGYSQASQFYRSKEVPFAKNQSPPYGGDDFDQGHEEVNHVLVPHGKGISHAVTFGNGYIPFDNYKKRPSISHHHNYNTQDPKDVAHSPTMNLPVGPAYSQAFLSQQADSYIGNEDDQNELQDRNHDRATQSFPNGRAYHDFSNPSGIGTHLGGVQGMLNAQPGAGAGVTSGLPPATIGGSRHGIILRDSIAFDDYNRRVAEFTKHWPANFGNNNLIPGSIGNNQQQLHGLSQQYDRNGVTAAGYAGGSTFASSLSQAEGQKGYAVKEDIVDTAPQDFRTTPLQTSQVQPLTIQIPQQTIQPIIHQQPGQHMIQQASQQIIHQQPIAQHSLQNFLPQTQVPLNYALPNFQGLVHG